MRCHYLSDLHLESQTFETRLPKGDVLIIAGDLCHACCLDPARGDRYGSEQRGRVCRFIDAALASFAHVLMVAGNHEPYDGVLEDTTGMLRRHLPGVTLLDNRSIDLGGIRFFGTTLWTHLGDGSAATLQAIRRGMGEYFFTKTRAGGDAAPLAKLRPEHTLRAHEVARSALLAAVTEAAMPSVIITHHAPSRRGLNARHAGNALDAAYASDLDDLIAGLDNVPVWVHGHTHVARTYRIGDTVVRSNALGFASRGHGANGFSLKASFDL